MIPATHPQPAPPPALFDLGDPCEPDPEYCPACDGEGVLLGHLGTLAHYRCRHCGMGWSS